MSRPPHPLAVIRDPDQARCLLDPLRRRILERLQDPDSAAGVARALELPRQRINYHVRELERAGLLTHLEDRRQGNCVERVVQATARQYVIDPTAAGLVSPNADGGEDGPYAPTQLLRRAARTIREVSEMSADARTEGGRLPTLSLETRIRFRSAAEQVEFARAIQELFDDLASRFHDEEATGGRTFRISLAGHPANEPPTSR